MYNAFRGQKTEFNFNELIFPAQSVVMCNLYSGWIEVEMLFEEDPEIYSNTRPKPCAS